MLVFGGAKDDLHINISNAKDMLKCNNMEVTPYGSTFPKKCRFLATTANNVKHVRSH